MWYVCLDEPFFPEVTLIINDGLNGVRFPDVIPAGSRVRARTILLDVGEVKESIQLESKVTIEINGVKKPDCVAEMITRSNFKITTLT
ncbi:MAG: hypothetical protein KAS19_04210 [Anaerolineales bacterium]|nr:hypothetical protein [Anaerolineales bacterium]